MDEVKSWQKWAAWVFLIGLLIAFGWVINQLLEFMTGADKIALASMVAVIGVVATTISGFWIKKLEKKHEVEAQFRERKVKLFEGFLREFDKLSNEGGDLSEDDLVTYLKDWQRKIVFWGGPQVVSKFLALRSMGEAKTIADTAKMLQVMGELILAMRKDLGLSNRGFSGQVFAANLLLRHGDFFLAHVKEHPDMPSDEYARVEAILEKGT